MQDDLEVHIGTHSPELWSRRAKMPVKAPFPRITGPQIATEDIDWGSLGLVPRWIGDDPSSAVAALEVSRSGAEATRFLDGAIHRDEPALYISTSTPPDRRNPAVPDRESALSVILGSAQGVELPHHDSARILTTPIALAKPPELADGLSSTDRDLALRIRGIGGAQWVTLEPYDPDDPDHEFANQWTPLLLTPDGHTVAGRWTDDDEAPPIYHYIVPRLPSYQPILRWLTERAVPDLIPAAAARTRRYIADQPTLHSTREGELTNQLAALAADYEAKKAHLEQALTEERAVVTPVREGLLFGTGSVLEAAVARVLADAGVRVERLDEVLGRTSSADLLIEHAGRRLLVEVKSASGNAHESLGEAPHRHLRMWPEVGTGPPVDGVVLVINHQHRIPPADRSPAVFERKDFVMTLGFPVVSALELFDRWRQGDAAGVRRAFGLDASPGA